MTEPNYTALTESEQRIWRMGYDKRGEEIEELVAAAREAHEYLDRISDEWDNSSVDTVFNHDKAHEAYLISEKLNAALVEVKK